LSSTDSSLLPVDEPAARRFVLPWYRRLLSNLPSSRPWPDPASWLPHLPFEIPDRVGLRDVT
jgi:hypothetical protein